MQEVFSFIFRHLETFLSCGLIILSIILLIVRKKPVSSILSTIYSICVDCICSVEESGVVGSSSKLNLCVKLVKELLRTQFPGLDCEKYHDLIVSVIENILKTPQKKKGE